jgi:uncharacterized membrane protein
MSDAHSAPSARVASVDLIRGAVMVLMAIDHVRVYAGVPAGGPEPAVFFTRWITHFCAPAFVFLAGSSAFLYGRTHAGLSRFLVTRGLWLVFLELTFMRWAWTFNFDYAHYEMAGVIWVIGWSMILMAAMVKLPTAVIGILGVAIIAGHNLMDPLVGERIDVVAGSSLSWLWKILYLGFWAGPIQFGPDGPNLIVLYSIVPWVGVMAAGYAFGRVLTLEPARRDRVGTTLGLGAIASFVVLRGFNLYGDPNPWNASQGMPALLAFLNTTKYPASLSFLLMTLGPTIALMPALERGRGRLARWITAFGRVPFFFYVLHIPLIHALALVVARIRLGEVTPWLFANHPMGVPPAPDGYMWSLALLYAIWVAVVVMLYVPCRWFAGLKARRKDPWLSYL